ncbi:hypothetical protein V8E54_011916 [Elaphomyces granulatus]
MTILDGPQGYNQRLFTKGLFHSGGIVLEQTGPFEPRIPRPIIITGWEPSPLKLVKEDFRIVVDFLRANPSSRSVVASTSKFGFPTLSINCICLYVDADDIADLSAFVASSNTITAIVNANLCANCS